MASDQANDPALGYRPGTYTTRFTEPTFTFTRDTTFRARGERIQLVNLDEIPSAAAFALAAEIAEEYSSYPFEQHDWVKDLKSRQVEYWGYPGTQIDFIIDDCPPTGCTVTLEAVLWLWGWPPDEKVRLLFIEVPGGPIGFEIHANQSRFDQYWTEVAEPILASIELMDG
jgi:hypothetical protein